MCLSANSPQRKARSTLWATGSRPATPARTLRFTVRNADERVAAIYVDVISPLGPRIQVTGPLLYCKAHKCRRKFAQPCWQHSRRRALAPGRRRTSATDVSRNRLTTQAKQILAHLTPELDLWNYPH